MKQTVVATALMSALAFASPAWAQTPNTTAQSGSMFVGGFGGAAAVQKIGGQVGAELGLALTDKIDVFGEGVWIQDAVTRRRLDVATSVAGFLQTSQGATASSTIKAPTAYGGASLHIALKTFAGWTSYVAIEAGAARVTLKPAFTLAGANVTATLSQYGVTLGSDLTGSTTKAAFGGGLGVRMLKPRWYVDGGFRVTSIRTTQQATNVIRAGAGFGIRF